MSDLSAILWVLIIGFWAGFGFREWGYRRAARHGPSAEEKVGAATIKAARDNTWTKGIVGEGFEVVHTTRLHVDGKVYRVEIAEDERA